MAVESPTSRKAARRGASHFGFLRAAERPVPAAFLVAAPGVVSLFGQVLEQLHEFFRLADKQTIGG